MRDVLEIKAAQASPAQIEALRGFARGLDESQLRDVLLSMSSCVAAGTDMALLETDAELSPNQVAEKLKMSRTHVYALLDSGELPFHRVGRDRRIRVSELLAFESRRQMARRELAEKFAHVDQLRSSAVDELAEDI